MLVAKWWRRLGVIVGGHVGINVTNTVVGLSPSILLQLQLGLEHLSSAVGGGCTCMYGIEGPWEGTPWGGSRGQRSSDCYVQ